MSLVLYHFFPLQAKSFVSGEAYRQLLIDLRMQVMEAARKGKLIGASLDARVLLHVEDAAMRQQLEEMNRSTNGADELRYIFITSQVRSLSAGCSSRRTQAP